MTLKPPREPLFFVMTDNDDDVDEYHDREKALVASEELAARESVFWQKGLRRRSTKDWVVEAIHQVRVKR